MFSSHINTFHLLDNCNGDVIVKVMSSRVKEKVLRDFTATKCLLIVDDCLTLSDIL